MATLANILNQLKGLHAIVDSAERQRKFIDDFARDNRLLAKFYADTLRRELARRGWFIAGSLYPHQFQPLARALKNRAENQVEEFLKIHIRGLTSDVRESALTRWRDRDEILADAFDAHIAGKFTLSVPVFLAQADGISAELLGAYLFTNRDGSIKQAASRIIESNFQKRPLAKSFLGLLLEASGLKSDTREREELSTLNRHGVLHGLDCDYATEGNSLRGIALISFLEWVAEVIPIKEESPKSIST
jgi:hypothetical protein